MYAYAIWIHRMLALQRGLNERPARIPTRAYLPAMMDRRFQYEVE